MKKLLAMLMCLMLACCGVCAQAEEAAPDLTGVWTLDAIVAGEMTVNPAMMGLTMTMTVNADGTIVADSNGEQDVGTWTQEGNLLIVGEDAFTYVDGKLTCTEESMGATMYFVRGDAVVEEAPAPVIIADATIADFNGVWSTTVVEMMGMEMPISMMGMGIVLTINNDLVGLVLLLADENGEVQQSEGAAACIVTDGVLTIQSLEEAEAMGLQLNLQLRSDGKMVYTMEQDGMLMTVVFERVEAE